MEWLRGATAVIRHAKPDGKKPNLWLLKLLERKPRKLAAVALANKMARILWAERPKVPCANAHGRAAEGRVTKGTAYRHMLKAA